MVARISVTAIMVLLAVYAFWGDALGAGHLFNPFGILFLALTVLVWIKWGQSATASGRRRGSRIFRLSGLAPQSFAE